MICPYCKNTGVTVTQDGPTDVVIENCSYCNAEPVEDYLEAYLSKGGENG